MLRIKKIEKGKGMIHNNQIKPNMPVICCENQQFATVDQMENANIIKLAKDETGQHHYIPLKWVTDIINGKIKIDCPRFRAMQEWYTRPPGLFQKA